MKKGIWLFMVFSPVMQAMNLLDAYDLARKNDPHFLQAHSQYLIDREQLSLAYAELGPKLKLNGQYDYQNKRDNGSEQRVKSQVQQLTLRLDQPLFDASAWAGLATAKASVKSAEARFQSEAQALFYRIVQVYLAVSVAESDLDNAKAKVIAVESLLKQALHRYDAGLGTKASVDEAQAAFESAKAEVIAATTGLANAQESVFRMTGQFCDHVVMLPDAMDPLSQIDFKKVHDWQDLALTQNYALNAAVAELDVARAKHRYEKNARMPDVSLNAQYQYDHESATTHGISHGPKAGVALSWRLYEGGGGKR